MPKHQNENISSRESQVYPLAQAGQTARFWQFGRPVLGGKLVISWMKYFHFGVLAFLQGLSKCFHLNLPSDFFYPMYPSNPQWNVN